MSHDHGEILSKVKSGLPSEEELCRLSELFKIFGDKTRVKILFSLFESEMCVCAIAELLEMEPSAISHQLKILRDAKLVTTRRSGKTVFYRLLDDHVGSLIAQGYEHITEEDRHG